MSPDVVVTAPCNVFDDSYTVVEHDAIESLTHAWADFCRSATRHEVVDVAVETGAPARRR